MELLSSLDAAALVGSALAVCFLVSNAKSLPLAHSFRLLPSLYRLLLRPRLFPASRTRTSSESVPVSSVDSDSAATTARTVLFKHHVTSSRAVLLDLDVNMHKSNSTFFADADINRAQMLTGLLGQGLAATGSRSAPAAIPLLAAVQCTFKREIGPFQAYDLSSRVLAWDNKSLFLATYFLKPGTKLPSDVEVAGGPGAVLEDASLRRCVYAVMVTRYVCKAGRETVAPAVILEAAGLLSREAKAAEMEGRAGLMAAGETGKAVRSGMQYVSECMV